ncbi:MAG: PAS domain-containing sensor histidine kinase [Deltaproteobacteria bacterium]|nr:PAS domain-containing sensor histidine kinase [Deltaproteobacteria bacterium]
MSKSRPFDEDLYRTLANSSQAGVYILQDGKFQFANPHIQEYAGYTEEEMLGMDSLSLIHPVDRVPARKNAVRMLKGQRFSPYEFRIITSDGRTKWILESVTSIHYGGRPAVLGNSMNITEQKEARNRLEELEALESSILDAIPHAVIGLHNRVFNFANNAVKAVFGWRPEELIGKNVRIFYRTDGEYEEIARRFYTALESRRTYSTEFPCRRKDGVDIICMVRASRIGETLRERRIVVTYEDITERIQAEKELEHSRQELRNLSTHQQTVREEERTRIAREIHDELGQTLTALKMDLAWLKNRLPAGMKPLHAKMQQMSKLADATIESVHRIATELRPGLLDDLGLAAAIEWQAADFQNRSGIACKATLAADDLELDRDLATALFRIFQETLTNIARHAGATRAEVSLERSEDRIVLTVADNGRGITRKQSEDDRAFGIIGMRERAHLWGGELRIAGSREEGTTVTVAIPLHPAKIAVRGGNGGAPEEHES